jgi:hypothetical protein
MSTIRRYLAAIGSKGGSISRRTLTPAQARDVVRVREARKLFRTHYATCFWWSRPDLVIGIADVPWVAAQLRKHGGRDEWRAAARLEAHAVGDQL